MKDRASQDDFERTMLPHLDAAYNLARWLVRDALLAEDVVQDAYERAFRYFASFRGGSSRAWLLQIVRHVAYSAIKNRRLNMEVSLGGGIGATEEDETDLALSDSNPGPEALLVQRQDFTALNEAINALPDAHRECLILHEVEAFSYREIAGILDVPIGTVMSRLARARRMLARHLQNAAQASAGPEKRVAQSAAR